MELSLHKVLPLPKKKRKKIALVVQRYGLEVNGGAELAARLLAEHLKDDVDIDVITTCAKNYYSWKNEYPAGEDAVHGVKVLRFKVDQERNKALFDLKSKEIFGKEHSFKDEEEWMRLQGPLSNKLFDYLYANKGNYDAFVFFTYLYATTYYGLPLVHDKSILIPTAHDEPPMYLSLFDRLFSMANKLIFLSEEEEDFVSKRFPPLSGKGTCLGLGFHEPAKEPAKLSPDSFRKKYRIQDDFLLYAGRVDESKGCGEMFDYFLRLKKETKAAMKLVLMGSKEMEIPKHKDIIALGFIPEEDKFNGMAAAKALVNPSPYESFSFAVLEAMACGTPVIVNGKCAVLKGHVERSRNGIVYGDYATFVGAITAIRKVKVNKNYLTNYSWPSVLAKYRKHL